MGPLHTVSEYAIQWIKKMQNEDIRSFMPRQDITDKFNDHVQVRYYNDLTNEDIGLTSHRNGSNTQSGKTTAAPGKPFQPRYTPAVPPPKKNSAHNLSTQVQKQRHRPRKRRLPRLIPTLPIPNLHPPLRRFLHLLSLLQPLRLPRHGLDGPRTPGPANCRLQSVLDAG